MALVYADMDALAEFQWQLLQCIPALEQQIYCNDELIEETIQKLREAVIRAEDAERSAIMAANRAEQQLAAAEQRTRSYNSRRSDDQEPMVTPSFYYEDVSRTVMASSCAKAHRARAEDTLSDFQAYVKRYRNQQNEGMAQIKKLLDKSGKFFGQYIAKLVEAKKCTVFFEGESSDERDWSRTANTPEEEKIIRSMAEQGEIDIPAVDPATTDPRKNTDHLPTTETGRFTGAQGNSEFIPNSQKTLQVMARYGRKSVTYRNNQPDFSPFSIHNSPWGTINTQVEIPHMTGNRKNPHWECGRRPRGSSHDPNYDLGNYAQADNELLAALRSGGSGRNISIADVVKFREDHHLIWHECADGKTMQLIPREIHNACTHSGGVSEQKYRMAYGNVTLPD